MNQMAGAVNYAAQGQNFAPKEVKGTAVDSINANLETLTGRVNQLAAFAGRISDGLLGFAPTSTDNPNGNTAVRPVSQSTQDHMRDLEFAFERLSSQINRLG